MLLYYGKQLFGKSVDNLSFLAQTILGIMLICHQSGSKISYKIYFNFKINMSLSFEWIE